MGRKLLVFWFCLQLHNLLATEGLSYYRKLLQESENNYYAAKLLYEKTNNMSVATTPVLKGFNAMANIMLCKHEVNPILKLNYFKKGKSSLEEAIANSPDNIELIFFRYSVQLNVPAVLAYNSSLKKDRQLLFSFLTGDIKTKQTDMELYENIKQFMIAKKIYTKEELENKIK